jgi:HD-like signal output (HDOD) protein
MIFKGDLSKYHPADAMMFLSQAGLDGVLSIADQEFVIALTFKAGRLIDAQSGRGDGKMLRCLHHEGRLNDSQIRQIQQIQRETGLSVRQIMGKLDFFPLAEIQPILKIGITEVLRQLFLLDHGSFNFSEMSVEDDGAQFRLDTAKIALAILHQADEYKDFKKSILTTDRPVLIRRDQPAMDGVSPSGKLILEMAAKRPSVADLLDQAPLPGNEVLEQVRQFLDQGIIALGDAPKAPSPPATPVLDSMFSAYKHALKILLGNDEVLPRLEAMLSFGKSYYDHMLILTARQREFIHCKIISREPGKGLVQKTKKGDLGRVDGDSVFATVHRSGIAFFGQTFPCRLVDQFVETGPNGDCALIPVLNGPKISIFLYACTARSFSGLCPHHYMELLSWVIAPWARTTSPSAADSGGAEARPQAPPEALSEAPPGDAEKRIKKMVDRIRDLPPLPTLVSQILQILSKPETPLEEIEAIISKDQALVAKLIQVGNSALYGGLQKVSTLRQVLTRLGLKTIRNLVVTASTRGFFMHNRKGMRLWGQFLWQHAVESALAARRIAESIKYPEPEEAFIGGLVHDIGKLVILMLFAESYREILKLKKVHQMASIPAETQVLGCNHEQVGRLLLDRWNMPDSAKACAEYHHRYQECGTHGDLVAIVACADHLSRQYGTNPESLQSADHAYSRELMAALKISPASQAALVEAVIDDFQKAELMIE